MCEARIARKRNKNIYRHHMKIFLRLVENGVSVIKIHIHQISLEGSFPSDFEAET